MPPMRGTLVRYWRQQLDDDACLRGIIAKLFRPVTRRGSNASRCTGATVVGLRSPISSICLWTSGGLCGPGRQGPRRHFETTASECPACTLNLVPPCLWIRTPGSPTTSLLALFKFLVLGVSHPISLHSHTFCTLPCTRCPRLLSI
jgi:hypothetical protein